jgi:hypothetical protein
MDPKIQREIYSLDFWIGQEIYAVIPMLKPDGHVRITIRNVEAAGIWIECEQLTIGFLPGKSERGALDDVGKVVAFVPFSQIVYIGTLDYKGQPTQRARVIPFAETTTSQAPTEPGN